MGPTSKSVVAKTAHFTEFQFVVLVHQREYADFIEEERASAYLKTRYSYHYVMWHHYAELNAKVLK
jgi:hypothetical protein